MLTQRGAVRQGMRSDPGCTIIPLLTRGSSWRTSFSTVAATSQLRPRNGANAVIDANVRVVQHEPARSSSACTGSRREVRWYTPGRQSLRLTCKQPRPWRAEEGITFRLKWLHGDCSAAGKRTGISRCGVAQNGDLESDAAGLTNIRFVRIFLALVSKKGIANIENSEYPLAL